MGHASAEKTTTRELRANLREMLGEAAKGKELVVTLRGTPYVRILPIAGDEGAQRYPLRGSVRAMSADFEAPLTWDAPPKKATKVKRRKKSS